MISEEALDALSEAILAKIMSPMVDVIKDSVHVWSGRQRTTVKYEVEKRTGNVTVGTNDPVWGKIVNYVIIEEFRHPQIRGTAVPLIFSLIRQGVLLGYQRRTVDATSPLR